MATDDRKVIGIGLCPVFPLVIREQFGIWNITGSKCCCGTIGVEPRVLHIEVQDLLRAAFPDGTGAILVSCDHEWDIAVCHDIAVHLKELFQYGPGIFSLKDGVRNGV